MQWGVPSLASSQLPSWNPWFPTHLQMTGQHLLTRCTLQCALEVGRLSKQMNSRCRFKLQKKTNRKRMQFNIYLGNRAGWCCLSSVHFPRCLEKSPSLSWYLYWHTQNCWQQCIERSTDSCKESIIGCKAELRVCCSFSEVTAPGRSQSAYFPNPQIGLVHTALSSAPQTSLEERRTALLWLKGRRKRIFKRANHTVFKPPPSEEAHKHSKPSQSQKNPGDSCKAVWLGSDSCLPSQPCCLVSSTLDSFQICHHRFSICSKFIWRQVFALHDQHG